MERVTFLKSFGVPMVPQILFIYFSFTAAEGGGCPNGRRGRPNRGAEGATPPEGERNPAEGGCFASTTQYGMYDFEEVNIFGLSYMTICSPPPPHEN